MKNILLFTVCVLFFASCSDWLDVKPKTAIQEKDLFKTESGFKDALTGLYIKMGNTNLYGSELSMNFLDRLARRYDYPKLVSYEPLYNYDGEYESRAASIYSKLYNLIANTNNLLYYIEENKAVLKTPDYYEIIKGEALGLRAFFHFELLRMFGPVYQLEPEKKCISYRKQINKVANPQLPASAVIDSIAGDLLEAASLLDTKDPLVFTANELDLDQDAFLRLRQLRMNKYAVKALLARLYCYKGDEESKALACKYAQEVIDTKQFPLMTSNKSNPILFSEHIFSIHVYQLDKIVTNLFENKRGDANLAVDKDVIDEIYGESNVSRDFRGNEVAFNTGTGDLKIPMKYRQSGYSYDYGGKEIVPLIRIPEMYYIIAECEPNVQKSKEALQKVRTARSAYGDLPLDEVWEHKCEANRLCPDGEQTNRVCEIMKEVMKETYSEGQLFYFYKRYNFQTIYPSQAMKSAYYVFKTPINEEIFGNNN